MGACQSSQAPVRSPPEAANPVIKSTRTSAAAKTRASASASTTTSSQASPASPRVHFPSEQEREVDIVEVARATPKGIRKGYSSGASSISDESDKDKGHTRNKSDVIRLESMKESLGREGNICTNIVPIETPFGRSIESVYDGVHDGKILGSGISGVVRLVTHRDTGTAYALKMLDIGLVKSEEVLEQLRDEIYIMLQLDHPNIVRITEVYESQNELCVVMNLCTGGDLYDRLDAQLDYHYTEAQCAQIVKQMLSAVRYLHSRNIVHRDIKLENFLFSSPEEDAALKMIDFGLSKHFDFGECIHDAVGTPYAVAPEVIRGSYNEQADMWSVGVLTYLLLSGETPFGGCDGEPLAEVRENILSGKFTFEPPEVWAHVSDAGKDFVRKLLNLDPNKRPSAKMAQRDKWIHDFSSLTSRESSGLNPEVVRSLVHFKEQSDMRKLLSEVLSFTLLPEQIKGLRHDFEKIDKDGSGEISLSDLRQVMMDNAEAGTLGALTEQEIEDIFDAMRVRKSDPKIRWHEFIAAALSQCQVDERNLKLAFDRLDHEGKGYIVVDDLRALLGADGIGTFDQSLSVVWSDGICQTSNGCKQERITYKEFRAILKGQSDTVPGLPHPSPGFGPRRISSRTKSIEASGSGSMPSLQPVDESSRVENTSFVTPTRTYVRQKSHSMKEKRAEKWVNYDEEDGSQSSLVLAGRESPCVLEVVSDKSRTPIEVNRALYRAHREMRMAVLDASKRFEEERARREHERKVAMGLPNGSKLHRRASLVMRRGSVADLSFATKDEKVQQEVDDASERAGRPSRRRRKRTVSDMTGMMGRSMPAEVAVAGSNG